MRAQPGLSRSMAAFARNTFGDLHCRATSRLLSIVKGGMAGSATCCFDSCFFFQGFHHAFGSRCGQSREGAGMKINTGPHDVFVVLFASSSMAAGCPAGLHSEEMPRGVPQSLCKGAGLEA